MPKKKTAKKAEGSQKKVTLTDMEQTDGMDQSQKYEKTSLDQVWGDNGVSEYRTLDAEVYAKTLDNMSKSDLKQEAIRVGLLPIDNVDQLMGRLMRQFNSHVSSYKAPKSIASNKVNLSDEAIRILGEGK